LVQRGPKRKVAFVAFLVGGITLAHYFTEWKVHYYHIFYQGLYFLPIILSGFWFGLRGALGTSLSISMLYLPFTIINWNGFSADDFNSVMEIVLYNVIALVLGMLRDRERVAQGRLWQSERLAAMGKAVSCLAHDLKTPLIAIGGLGRLARKNIENNDSSFKEKLDVIVKEANRLEKMVKEMLDFSRPLELHPIKGYIDDVVNESLLIISDLAQAKRVKVQNLPSGDLPSMFFDSDRIKQAFINLLTNAIEASPEEGAVWIHCYRKRKNLIVDVKDQGIGIPSDKREEVFSPFFTTKNGGTGLGLAIVKKIVEAHGGYLEVLENPEKGVTFRVTIPFL
jgi:two-component system sensor histidine kinase HydH